MTTFVKWINSPFVLAALLIAAAAIDLILLGLESDLSKSDWGTWVGSIGTVATLVGTLWLATDGERKRKRDARTLARLHSAGMVLRLAHARAAVDHACKTLSTSTETPIELTIDHLNDLLYRFSSINVWQVDDLVPMIELPNHTATKLAQVADHLTTAKHLLSNAIRHYPGMNHEERASFVFVMHGMLTASNQFLEDAINVCNAGFGAN